jgi:hypothetical protein
MSFARVVMEERAAPTTGESMIEIELKDARLRIPRSTRASTIVALLKALRAGR